MRDVMFIGFVVFISVAGAVITALPVVAWWRKRRRRKAVYGAFLRALREGRLCRTRFSREKEIGGNGFIDRLTGTAGALDIVLSRRFRPFRRIDAFWLHVDGETFAFEAGIEDAAHPIVQSYYALRWRKGDAIHAVEAN